MYFNLRLNCGFKNNDIYIAQYRNNTRDGICLSHHRIDDDDDAGYDLIPYMFHTKNIECIDYYNYNYMVLGTLNETVGDIVIQENYPNNETGFDIQLSMNSVYRMHVNGEEIDFVGDFITKLHSKLR